MHDSRDSGIMGRRVGELVAMAMIGDSIITLIRPRRHVTLWRQGPGWWRGLMDRFTDHPTATRGLALMELGSGLWLAFKASRDERPTRRTFR